jgi:hypothetical protein
MSNDTTRRRSSRSAHPFGRRQGLAALAASVAGLALAGPASAQLLANQSQSGSNGVLQAVVTNVQVTANTVQAPVAVHAPVRVLSPGNDTGASADSEATGGGSGGGGSASQTQSGSNGASQIGVTNVQVAGNTVQAPVAVVGPIRILSPGEDRGTAGAAASTGGSAGSADQSQKGENGALQALLTSLQVAGTSVQTPIAVYAPVRVLSPGANSGEANASTGGGGAGGGSADQSQNGQNGALQGGITNVQIAGNTVQAPIGAHAPVRVLSPGDNSGEANASTGGGGAGGSSVEQSQNGENGALQAGVTNAQVADNTAQAPVAVTAPVRVLSPGDTTTGGGGSPGGGGGGSPGGGGGGGGGSDGGELGAGARGLGTGSGSFAEVLAAVTGGGSLPYTGAPLGLLVLLGAGLLLGGARLRAAGTEPGR